MSGTPLDHLVYAVPNLAEARERFAEALGAEPRAGGRHEGLGTHNAILPLEDSAYVELIAADPERPAPTHARPFGLDALEGPRLATWAARTRDIDAAVQRARDAGYDPGRIVPVERVAPDGTSLRWRLSVRAEATGDGLVPFLIDWGDATHPADAAPARCRLRSLRAYSPHADVVRAALSALRASLPVDAGDRPRLEAVVEGPSGVLTLD